MGAGTLPPGDAGAHRLNPVGIVVATAVEARCLDARRWRPGIIERLSPEVFATLSGIGEAAARAAVDRLYEAGARAFVSFGSAAGLDPSLRAGALLLPDTITSAGASPAVDARWRAGLVSRLSDSLCVHGGTLVQVDRVLHDADAKRRLRAETGAVAADMESAAVVAAAAARACPAVVVRAIADTAGTAVPAWVAGALDARGRTQPGRLLAGWWHHSGATRALLQLARDWRAAARTLRAVATLAGSGLHDLVPGPHAGA